MKKFSNFLPLNFRGVKKCIVSEIENNVKNVKFEIEFSSKGLPEKMKFSKTKKNLSDGIFLFEYKDDLLFKTMVSNGSKKEMFSDVRYYFFNENKLLEDLGQNKTCLYKNENKILTYEKIYCNVENFDFFKNSLRISSANTLLYDDGGLNNYELKYNTTKDFFPLKISTNYLDKKIFYEFLKKNDFIYELNENTNKNKVIVQYLKQGLIKQITFNKGTEAKIKQKTTNLYFNYEYF